MDKYRDCVKNEFNLIREWFRAGVPESDITQRLGVSASSLLRYRKNHPEFNELWLACRAERDDLVESALFRRAVGYDTAEGERVKHVPPDVKAAVFWLKNRRPRKWKDHSGAVPARLSITLLDEERNL